MADRKPFLLRIDRDVLDALQRWANDDLRSLNGQIEFVLRRALQETGHLKPGDTGRLKVPSETPRHRGAVCAIAIMDRRAFLNAIGSAMLLPALPRELSAIARFRRTSV